MLKHVCRHCPSHRGSKYKTAATTAPPRSRIFAPETAQLVFALRQDVNLPPRHLSVRVWCQPQVLFSLLCHVCCDLVIHPGDQPINATMQHDPAWCRGCKATFSNDWGFAPRSCGQQGRMSQTVVAGAPRVVSAGDHIQLSDALERLVVRQASS